jgi:hypothetical protein
MTWLHALSVRRRARGRWRWLAFGFNRACPGDGFGWCLATSARVAAARSVRRLREVLGWPGSSAVTDAWTHHDPRDTASAVADVGVLCAPRSATARYPPGFGPWGGFGCDRSARVFFGSRDVGSERGGARRRPFGFGRARRVTDRRVRAARPSRCGARSSDRVASRDGGRWGWFAAVRLCSGAQGHGRQVPVTRVTGAGR